MRQRFWYVCLLFLFATPTLAQTINYQGQLLIKYVDETIELEWWEPANEVDVEMAFALYTSATGGTAIWSESQTVSTDYEGVYAVQLGSVNPFEVNVLGPYWLGVTIDDNDEMTPRLPIGSLFVVSSWQNLLNLLPHSVAPDLCTSANAGTLAITSTYNLCICNGNSWRFVGYGTACQW